MLVWLRACGHLSEFMTHFMSANFLASLDSDFALCCVCVEGGGCGVSIKCSHCKSIAARLKYHKILLCHLWAANLSLLRGSNWRCTTKQLSVAHNFRTAAAACQVAINKEAKGRAKLANFRPKMRCKLGFKRDLFFFYLYSPESKNDWSKKLKLKVKRSFFLHCKRQANKNKTNSQCTRKK